jgi:hypothetical protein
MGQLSGGEGGGRTTPTELVGMYAERLCQYQPRGWVGAGLMFFFRS